jgi:hypothetical protein
MFSTCATCHNLSYINMNLRHNIIYFCMIKICMHYTSYSCTWYIVSHCIICDPKCIYYFIFISYNVYCFFFFISKLIITNWPSLVNKMLSIFDISHRIFSSFDKSELFITFGNIKKKKFCSAFLLHINNKKAIY